MSEKNDRKIRKSVNKKVKDAYVKAQGVLYDQIKEMPLGKRFVFALMILFKRLEYLLLSKVVTGGQYDQIC